MLNTHLIDKEGRGATAANPLVKRHAWMLFTDLNTRFSILMEECAHLQDMVWAMLTDLDDPLTINHDRVQDFKKPVLAQDESRSPWSQTPPRQRGLRSLYNQVGALYLAIEANQRTCRGHFNHLCMTWRADQFFWFVAQRGLFIRSQFDVYTDQLEHAQFKLIQIAENKPGSLPQPTLLRRWNSALFGDFLSAYSRHVDWETALLAWCEKEKDPHLSITDSQSFAKFFQDRQHQYIVHSWGHISTSRVRSHAISPSALADNGKSWRFHSIRSAFFYLEMPLLFPILYHECAHIHLEIHADEGGLFADRADLTTLLADEAEYQPHLPQQRTVWHALTGELWADLIAVALGGVGFVAALAMQLFGNSDGVFFETDQVPIDQLGSVRHRIWDVPIFSQDQSFWEVRLRLAIAACQQLHATELDDQGQSWLHGLQCTLEFYRQGANEVFDFSEEHRQHWAHRSLASDEIVSRTLDAFSKGPFDRLKHYVGNQPVSTTYRINRDFGKEVEMAVNGLYEAIFGSAPSPSEVEPGIAWGRSHKAPGRRNKRLQRIEEISLRAKWCFSAGAIAKIDELQSDTGSLELVTDTYANRMRNDGSGAFRLAMEWVLARLGATDAIADSLRGRDIPGFPEWLADVLGKKETNGLEIWEECIKHLDDNEKGRMARWLKLRNFDTDPRYQDLWPELTELLDRTNLFPKLDKWLGQVGAHLGTIPEANNSAGQAPWFKIAPLGTLSLGVISPQFVASRGEAVPYGDAMRVVHRAFAQNGIVNDLNTQIEGMKLAFGSESGFSVPTPYLLPLLGEYNFVLYREHLTPVERQHESPSRVQALLKPRAVLRLFRSGGGILSRDSGQASTAGPVDQRGASDVVAVSLIEFAYRWQAYELRDRLDRQSNASDKRCLFTAAELFLSSGWETCILVLRLPQVEDFWTLFWEQEGFGLGCGCEHVQTYFGAGWEHFDSIVNSEPPTRNPASDDRRDVCNLPLRPNERDSLCEAFYECSGRDDFTVCWHAKTVEEMFICLNRLSREFWQGIDRLSLSCRRLYAQAPADADAEADVGAQPRGTLEFTGHIVRLGPLARNSQRFGAFSKK